ncbi:MAG: FAD-binding protein, partial [Candidatus Ornithospirochaeta sp.]|nr:FAD-binding protein [Candidatus Ornithospirochaeta sp.]
MVKDLDITLSPEEAFSEESARKSAARKAGVREKDISALRFIRKSIDARRKDIRINARVRLFIGEEGRAMYSPVFFPEASPERSAVVVGFGPAGIFASLALLENGIRPIVLERGKDVHSRRIDTAVLSREGILDEESNYSFGEGGAGAFSDGKLYTRSVKRGDVRKVLALLCQHGADQSILYETHPHVGTDKLPTVIENMRNTIVSHGGEVLFGKKVTSLIISGGRTIGARCSDGSEYMGPVILATGHSAKDVYSFLHSQGITLEAKDTAIGVRLEHPQALIDRMQYHSPEGRGRFLPPASYSFVTQSEGRGVYSFCMCPGGSVVPSASEEGMLSVNGMSSSSRSGSKANAAMVVQIRQSDIPGKGVFSMLDWVEEIERRSFCPLYQAPAQRMADFVQDKFSSTLPSSTYAPGLVSKRMDEVLPPLVSSSLRLGFKAFDHMTRGRFLTNEAVMIGSETRTSSPVRILRDEG